MQTIPPRTARTVLIIDDSEAMRHRVESILRERGVFRHYLLAPSGARGLELLLRNEVDMILCDLEMPGLDGLKFLKALENQTAYLEVPLIMLTGRQDVSFKVAALNAGASDYLTKPFHEEELVARVRVHLHIKALQDELRAKNARLQELSVTDELTGVANRRRLMQVLRDELARAARDGSTLAFLMLDLDHFKAINDRHGHQAGDGALVFVVERLTEALEEESTLGRYGGEELGLVVPRTRPADALALAERCRQAVAARPFRCGSGEIPLSVSVGVAIGARPAAGSVDALIQAADAALYRAKTLGRNRVACATGACEGEPSFG